MSNHMLANVIITGSLAILSAGILVGAWLYLRSKREEVPEDWTDDELEYINVNGRRLEDPRAVPLIYHDLVPAVLFEHVAEEHPVRVDWEPPGFTQWWTTLNNKPADTEAVNR